HEQIEMAVGIEIAEDQRRLARRYDDAGIPGFHKLDLTFLSFRVEYQHAGAGGVEEIGPAIVVDIGYRQRITLDPGTDTALAQADFVGNVLEGLALALRSEIAIQAQAVVAVGQEDIGPAIAVVIDPGGCGQRVEGFLRQQMAIVPETAAEVGEQLWP